METREVHGVPPDPPGLDADAALVRLYQGHYVRMVQIAYLLTRDAGRAEELVQDAFVDLHQRWPRLRDTTTAVAYLRQSVVNRARSALRHLKVVRAHDARTVLQDVVSAESSAMEQIESQTIVRHLNGLPTRQREVLVLRYYGQLSEAEIAATLGISAGAVKSHCSRGLRALRPVLGATS